MGKVYAVRVVGTDSHGDSTLEKRVVVYADSVLEAKVQGAEQMGVDQGTVEVGEVGWVPTDDEMRERAEQMEASAAYPEYMRGAAQRHG